MVIKNEIEWITIWFIFGFTGPFALYKYTDNGYSPTYLLFISYISILISLVGAAKAGGPNIFKVIRQTPKFFKDTLAPLKTKAFWLSSPKQRGEK